MIPTPHNAPEGFQWISRITGNDAAPDGVGLAAQTSAGETTRLEFTAVADGVWRCIIIPKGEHVPPATGMLVRDSPSRAGAEAAGVPGAYAADSIHTAASASAIALSNKDLTAHFGRDPFSFRFEDKDRREVFRDNPGDVDGFGRPFVLPLGYTRAGESVNRIIFSFHLDPDEHLFGLGEKFLPLSRRGQRIIAWTQDAFGSTSERSHKNIPLLISTRGYGLFLDTGARITWDLGTTSCQSCTVTAESSALRFFLIAGQRPADILKRYAGLTGFAPVPPRWTFGLWISSGGTYRDRDAMETLVAGLEKHQVAADVVHVDPWWMRWRQYCDFRWNTDAFPDPAGYIGSLHAKGLRLCLWEHPYISVESELFTEGKDKGYFLRRPDGSVYVIDYGLSLAPRPDGIVREATPDQSWNARVAIVDLTNPDAVRWFQDLHRPVLRMGADVFKTDFGEDIPRDALFHNGQSGASMHNLYPLLYNEAVAAVTEEERGHGVVWGRAAVGGSQRSPVCWSGDPAADFDSLACTIRGGLSMGMCGVPFWSNDIGGYRGMPDAELYVRWAQFGLFCSHSRMHGDSPREPWFFGDDVLRIVRSYINLRYRFFPYLYSTALEARLTGMPVMRALALMWPDDPSALDMDQQYMLGPWLMVAPVVHRSGRKIVYLPAGGWIDFWTGERLCGPCTLHLEVPLETLPLFVREGAIIPQMEPAKRIPEGRIDPLTLDLYPSGSSSYLFHDEEGTTKLTIGHEQGGTALKWDGPVERKFRVQLHPSYAASGEPLKAETERAKKGVIVVQSRPRGS